MFRTFTALGWLRQTPAPGRTKSGQKIRFAGGLCWIKKDWGGWERVCKTFIRGFDSHPRLQSADYRQSASEHV